MYAQGGGVHQISIGAPAKINIGLRILGKRPDGYHEIWTIFQQISLADEILLSDSPDLAFTLNTDLPNIPDNDDNLCMRAARLLKETTGYPDGAQITLNKVVPAGAGLGGGSSDAASTLVGLNRLWGTGLSQRELLDLAARLGSDVPFFIIGNCCIGTGRGEVLEPIEAVISDPIVLLCPNVKISTNWAYKNIKNYRLTSNRESIIFQDSLRKSFQSRAKLDIFLNDFEPLIYANYSELKALKEALHTHGAYYVTLSGSGSSIFGVFGSTEEAVRASKEIAIDGVVHFLG